MPNYSSKKWASDASSIDINGISKYIYINTAISGFLESNNTYFITANKGMGKTLLLKKKRSLLGSEDGVTFIPPFEPLDNLQKIKNQSIQIDNFFSNIINSISIWNICIKLSVISHLTIKLPEEDLQTIKEFSSSIYKYYITNKLLTPTKILYEILSYFEHKDFLKNVDKMEKLVSFYFSYDHKPLYIFIDKLDQGLSLQKKETWINLQNGLIQVAWEINENISKFKIFTSIRFEAFSILETDEKSNIESATLTLNYNFEELESILDLLTEYYEAPTKSFKEFIGIPKFNNTNALIEEDSIKYISRHTIGRPRDFVLIIEQLSNQRKLKNFGIQMFRDIVNNTSETKIVPNLLNEVKIFLEYLKDAENKDKFFSLIHKNILLPIEIRKILLIVNEFEINDSNLNNYEKIITYNPFLELYNAGLIGYVESSTRVRDYKTQVFKQPYNAIINTNLPSSKYYLIHPALHRIISNSYTNNEVYYINKNIIVGHDYEWLDYYNLCFNIQKTLMEYYTIDGSIFTYSIKILKEIIKILGDREKIEEFCNSPQYHKYLKKIKYKVEVVHSFNRLLKFHQDPKQ